MKDTWYLSIPRLITILFAVALYGIALFSIFRKSRKIKLSSPQPDVISGWGSSEDISRSPFGYSDSERRIYPRAELGVGIRYKAYGERDGLHIFKEGKSRDISEGGILLETYEKLDINDKLELKLKLPMISQFMLIRSSIVWTKEVEIGKLYLYGISFTEIDPNDKKMIAKYIANVQSLKESGG